jgi:hypothetical protein
MIVSSFFSLLFVFYLKLLSSLHFDRLIESELDIDFFHILYTLIESRFWHLSELLREFIDLILGYNYLLLESLQGFA